MKNVKKFLFVLIILLMGVNTVHADAPGVNLTIRDRGTVVFTGDIPAQPDSTVLSILNDADTLSDSFSVSNVQNYSFGAYLKCITDVNGEQCDNWQYAVNGVYPTDSIDQKTLSGGESVYIYFGPQNKITLSEDSIKTTDTLTVTTQAYDYQNNDWATRTGVTVGLTQPNPDDQWTPIEVETGSVDENGEATFSSIPAGSYNVGVKEDGYFPTEALTVTTPPPTSHGGGGEVVGGSVYVPPEAPAIKPGFDINKALNFLVSQQKDDGSWGVDLYTDWIAMALATTPDHKPETIKLIKYLEDSKTSNVLLTDLERHAMALMSLGLNPYNTNGENYIEKIVAGFDGKQFGDPLEDNDDIFALIVLQNAGYSQNEKMIADDVSFVLGAQKEDGSWDGSVDMTGASIEALSAFSPTPEIGESLKKAENFLKQNQKDDGSWGDNASGTAWALEGILALGEKPEDWIKNEVTPFDYLATTQDTDGGIKDEIINNKIWETAYVVSALSGKTWNQIMQKFEKPEIPIAVKMPKKLVKKQEVTATVINATASPSAVTPPPAETAPQTEIPQKGWFSRLLENIFNAF